MHITTRLLRVQRLVDPTPIYAEGVMLTYDHGNQCSATWLQHVCGDALMQKGIPQAEPIGDVAMPAVRGALQCHPAPMTFLSLP